MLAFMQKALVFSRNSQVTFKHKKFNYALLHCISNVKWS